MSDSQFKTCTNKPYVCVCVDRLAVNHMQAILILI